MVSLDRAQLEARKAERNVDGNRTLDRERLQCEGASGTTDQNVDTGAKTNADFAGGPDICAGERPRRRTGGRREYRPAEHATGADADIDADSMERALISLRWKAAALGKLAFHRLMTEDHKANTGIEPA